MTAKKPRLKEIIGYVASFAELDDSYELGVIRDLLAVVVLELSDAPAELFVRVNRKIADDNVKYDRKVRARAAKRADAWKKLT